MATRFEAFCNTTTDLQAVISDVDNFDRKRLLRPDWKTTGTTNLYKLSDSGYISQLYINSVEATAVGDTPNADNEYAYDSASDSVTFFLAGSSTSALNGSSFESSEDWATLKQKVVNEQADRIRSYLNRPVYKRKKDTSQGASERSYDWILIRSNACLAVADLIRSVNPEKAAEIESQVFDLEAGQGLMDKLKRGEYTLWNEASARSLSGVVTEVSVHTNTTGVIEDVKQWATPKIEWDDVRVVITAGGTFSAKSENSTIKYKVLTQGVKGIATQESNPELIDGNYQGLAYGLSIRFSEGVYTTSDEWSIIVQGGGEDFGTIKTGQVYR
tara:strand:- start:1905 stop:2891 length:987 start_codon:yes stop_codon:yes gene_type:complete